MNDESQFDRSRRTPGFDALMRDAAHSYNAPPDVPDAALDALFTRVEATLAQAPDASEARPALTVVRGDIRTLEPRSRIRRVLDNAWVRAAAVLLLGVALGRASVKQHAPSSSVASEVAPDTTSAVAERPSADQHATSQYLERAATLLAALPAELNARRTDPAYLSQADALLLQTRLLQDSPAAADPALRSLFDDLEVVFAQVVRLHADRDPTRIDFLNQALEQRDVLPRLRDAVAENAGD